MGRLREYYDRGAWPSSRKDEPSRFFCSIRGQFQNDVDPPRLRKAALTERSKNENFKWEKDMRSFGRTSLTFLVWLTAIMTVVAGTPHFVCVCPDGRVKSYCFGPTRLGHALQAAPRHCCGGVCCTKATRCDGDGPADQQASATTCCGHRSRGAATTQVVKGGLLVSSRCCVRLVAKAAPAIRSSSDTCVVKDLELLPLLTPDLLPNRHFSAAIAHERQAGERPPPTDLTIALQHFLI